LLEGGRAGHEHKKNKKRTAPQHTPIIPGGAQKKKQNGKEKKNVPDYYGQERKKNSGWGNIL